MLSFLWICIVSVVSCLEIALSSTTAITVACNGDTAMTMTGSCNGDYNHTAVTTAAICNNSECNKLRYLPNMPWHTPWQWFAIVVTILNHHICQRTWDVEQGHNGLQHLCVRQHICALANPILWDKNGTLTSHHLVLWFQWMKCLQHTTVLDHTEFLQTVMTCCTSQQFKHCKHSALEHLSHLHITMKVHLSISAIHTLQA